MNRINENTYIDTSLITCSEYQLFIDETRRQGKHYQPDHWMSFEFARGQADKPILGVRFLDAVDFCDWLTNREKTEWNYRLPTISEAEQYPILNKSSSFGYWGLISLNNPEFIPATPSDNPIKYLDLAREIDQYRTSILKRAQNLNNAIHQARIRKIDPAHAFAFALQLDLSGDLAHALARGRASAKTIHRASLKIKDLNSVFGIILSRDIRISTTLGVMKTLVLIRNIVRALSKNPESDLLACIPKIGDTFVVKCDISKVFQALSIIKKNKSAFEPNATALSSALDLNIFEARDIIGIIPDLLNIALLFTIVIMRQEGISPAIEGIRIVKEKNIKIPPLI
jgi:hypothetical protein